MEITNEQAMKLAIQQAYDGIRNGDGGPFGCVIVKDGKVIGQGHNCVVKNNDPTCHGEVQAIRDACKNTKNFDLSGSILYTTAQPCPMCLGAILWANIKQVYQGCNIKDTDTIGFRDDKFYDYLNGKGNLLSIQELDRTSCLKLFSDYNALENKTQY